MTFTAQQMQQITDAVSAGVIAGLSGNNQLGTAGNNVGMLGAQAEGAGIQLSNLQGSANGLISIFRNTGREIANLTQLSTTVNQGNLSQAVGQIPGVNALAGPIQFAERVSDLSAGLEQSGVAIQGNLDELLRIQGDLRLNDQQILALAQSQELLRASGMSTVEALRGLQISMQQLDEGVGVLERDQLKSLGIGFDQQAVLMANLANIMGPSVRMLENGFGDLDDQLDDNIQDMSMLSKVYGVTIEEQMSATQKMMTSSGALSRQMNIITNPKAINNLQRFANLTAAIGESRLAEGMISGVGIPTPGNELEAAMKPMTMAIMGQMNRALAEGDTRRYRELEGRLQEVSATENARLMKQFGAVAPYMGSEFGFLNQIAQQQRGMLLGTEFNQQTGQGSYAIQQREMAFDQTANLLDNLDKSFAGTVINTQAELSKMFELSMQGAANILNTSLTTAFTNGAAEITAGINNSVENFVNALGDPSAVQLSNLQQGIDASILKPLEESMGNIEAFRTDQNNEMINALQQIESSGSINNENLAQFFQEYGEEGINLAKRIAAQSFIETNPSTPSEPGTVIPPNSVIESSGGDMPGRAPIFDVFPMIRSWFSNTQNNDTATPSDDRQSFLELKQSVEKVEAAVNNVALKIEQTGIKQAEATVLGASIGAAATESSIASQQLLLRSGAVT